MIIQHVSQTNDIVRYDKFIIITEQGNINITYKNFIAHIVIVQSVSLYRVCPCTEVLINLPCQKKTKKKRGGHLLKGLFFYFTIRLKTSTIFYVLDIIFLRLFSQGTETNNLVCFNVFQYKNN